MCSGQCIILVPIECPRYHLKDGRHAFLVGIVNGIPQLALVHLHPMNGLETNDQHVNLLLTNVKISIRIAPQHSRQVLLRLLCLDNLL